MFSPLVKQMEAQEDITERLKADNQMRLAGLMNCCKAQVENHLC